MTGKELIDLYNKGVPLQIRFNQYIEDIELQFEKGMLADIELVNNTIDGLCIYVNEKNYKKYNSNLEKPFCFNKDTGKYDKKWSEVFKREDSVEFYDDYNHIYYFEIVESSFSELIKEYNESNSELSYVDWLQEEVCRLRFLKEE